MSNCTVNKCLHSNVPKTVTYPSEPSLDPTCDNTFGSLQSKTGIDQTKLEATRDAVVKECNGGNKCFQGLTCVDGNECDQLYKDLLQKGWGDKDTVGTVLYNVNHASPDNLRDQLKYELCRRASCIPKPLSTTPSAGGMWKDMFKSYRCIFWFAAFFPVLWIMGSLLLRPFKETNNVLPSVFAGYPNNQKEWVPSVIYLIGVVLGLLFYSMVAGKYEIKKFGMILLYFLVAFIPIFNVSQTPKKNEIFKICWIVLKLAALAGLIHIISTQIESNSFNYIRNIEWTGVTNGIMYFIVGLYSFYNAFLPKTNNAVSIVANVIMGFGLLACAGLSIYYGVKGENDTTSGTGTNINLQDDARVLIKIAIAALGISVLASGVSIKNYFVTILMAFLLFNMIDSSNLYGAVDTYSTTWINILLSVWLCIVIPIYIKGIRKAFSGTANGSPSTTMSTFFSIYTAMSGIQTFLGIFAPPILLSLMTISRTMEAILNARNPHRDTNSDTWSFMFCGSVLTKAFNYAVDEIPVNQITTAGGVVAQQPADKDAFKFNPALPVGVSNAVIFNYRP